MCGEAGRDLGGGGNSPAPADPISGDGVEGVAPVVLERVSQSVGVTIGATPSVGDPASQSGRRIAAYQVDIHAVGSAGPGVLRNAGDLRRHRYVVPEVGWEVVACKPGPQLVLGFQTADDESLERLVVALHTEQRVGAQILLEPRDEMRRPLVPEVADRGWREVEEVVGLDELLVAGALRVEAARDAQPARAGEEYRSGEAR